MADDLIFDKLSLLVAYSQLQPGETLEVQNHVGQWLTRRCAKHAALDSIDDRPMGVRVVVRRGKFCHDCHGYGYG